MAEFFLVGFRQSDTLGDRAAGRSGCADDGERLRITFDDHLHAGLHTLQDSGKVAHGIGFAYVQHKRFHTCDDTAS